MNSDFSKLSKEERELRLTALALGEVAPNEAEEIHQAIAADAELAREFERLKQTVELVRETAAMDRRVSKDGTPLRLDEARRKKLLETFQTPAPRAVKPQRRRKLWFVPMSVAAVLVGLLVVSVTELGDIGPWRKARASRATSLWGGSATKPYVTGTYFSDFDSSGAKKLAKRANEQTTAEFASGDSKGVFAGESVSQNDFSPLEDIVAQKEIVLNSGLRSKRGDDTWKIPHDVVRTETIALPTDTDGDGTERAQINGQWDLAGNDLGAAWHYLDKDQKRAGASASVPVASSTPAVAPVVIGEVMHNPPAAPSPVVQGGSESLRANFALNSSPITGGYAFAAGNYGQSPDSLATAPAESLKEVKDGFATDRSVKGIAWPESQTQNRFFYIQNESLDQPAVTTMSGRQATVPVNDVDYTVHSHALAGLYQNSDLAAPKAAEPTPSPEKSQELGMSIYSVNAVGYVDTALKPAFKIIADSPAQPSGSVELYNSYSATGPKPASPSTLTVTPTDSEAKKYAEEARQWEANSKQLLTEVERAWADPVSRPFGVQGGSGPTSGIGGGGGAAVASTATTPSGRGGGGRGGGGRGSRRTEDAASVAAQPAAPEVRGVIDSVSRSDEVIAMTPQQLTIDAKFMDVNQDSRAFGFDFGNTALNNQGVAQNGAVPNANTTTYFRDHFMDSDAGVSLRSDDGAVVYLNGTEIVRTNALVSNQSWGLGANTSGFNDSSWYGKDGRENLSSDTYHFSVAANPTPPLSFQWKVSGEKPASGEYAVSAGSGDSGSLAFLDNSIATADGTVSLSVGLTTNASVIPQKFPATAGGKTFVANSGSIVVPQGPASGTAFTFGQSQQGGGSGVGSGGFGARAAFGNRLASAASRAAGTTGGTDAPARGFFDDGIDGVQSGGWKRATREVNGRVDIQLPAPANEEQLSRRSGLMRPLHEIATADSSGPRNQVVESLLGVDAAGLPIADLEAREKKLDKVNLNYGGIVAEDRLEKENAPAPPAETGKPVFSGFIVGGVPSPSASGAIAPVTDAQIAAQVAVRRTPAQEAKPKAARQEELSQLQPEESAQSVARTNRFVARYAMLVTNGVTRDSSGEPQSVVTVGAAEKARRLAQDTGSESALGKTSIPAPTPQPEVLTRDNAFSTFSLNVSDVSFKLAAASLEKGAMPEVANIRSEEFINAFDYRDPMPAPGAPISFAWERARYPFAHNRDVVRLSVKTAAQGREAGKPLNIVLLLDNSGSMERADRVRIIQESLRTLAAQLKPQDKLSVVTFSRTARLWADGVSGAQAAEVANKIGELTPEGGTNLEDALDLAYRTALRHYAATAVNRVVLLTDGAANLGNAEPKTLKAKVESFRKQGVALDCFGIGWEGFNDDLLEQLSRNGDGRYGFVNTPEEAASEFVGQLAGALRVAASDVKMQVEFNPKRVTAFRQIGYAKHQLTKEQFRDNKVDAAEIGAAESGNALYVIETNPNGQGPIATVRARFRVPQTSDYREHEWVVPFGSAVELEQSSPSLRLAASASAFSEWLAGSPFAGEVTTDRLLQILSGVPETYGADPRPKKLEWMIRQAKSISGK